MQRLQTSPQNGGEDTNMKFIYLLIGLMLIGNVSATDIDIVYINESTTAEVYYDNGSSQYFYNETNTLSDIFTTVMVSGTVNNNDDLLDNPTIVYGKIIFILTVIFFAFMFLLIVWIIKKVLA